MSDGISHSRQSGMRMRVGLDGVVRGRFTPSLSSKETFSSRPIVTPPMLRARKQLDAVLLRERERRGLSYRTWRLAHGLFLRRLQVHSRRCLHRLSRFLPDFECIPPKKALYASLIGGVSFGMVTMSLFHDFTDSRAEAITPMAMTTAESITPAELERELGGEIKKYDPNSDIFLQFFSEAEKEEYGAQIEELVKGYPIEDMLPYILEKDRIVAAFLVGIAKKESNWGKRVPVLDGQDCFNYWGYRGIRRLMGTGGHTCFNSKKDAVDTVALRLEKLINSNKLDTPAKMVIWKCGYSCEGHSRESVRKWIADVDLYFRELQGDPEEDGLVMNPNH
jgi:hypothetical protein